MTDALHPRQRHGDRYWIRREDRKRILAALRGRVRAGTGLRFAEAMTVVESASPRPVSKATVYRILAEAGWSRDWTWIRGSGRGRRILHGEALRTHAEAIQGRPLSHSSVYRVLRRHGWERHPVWRPPHGDPMRTGTRSAPRPRIIPSSCDTHAWPDA